MTNWWWLCLLSHVEPLHVKVRQLGCHHAENKEKKNNCSSPLELWSVKLAITHVLRSITSVRESRRKCITIWLTSEDRRVELGDERDLTFSFVWLLSLYFLNLFSLHAIMEKECHSPKGFYTEQVRSSFDIVLHRRCQSRCSACYAAPSRWATCSTENVSIPVKKTAGRKQSTWWTLQGDWPDAVLDIPID